MDAFKSVRRAVEADAGAIAIVHVQSWRETYPGILPEVMLTTLSVEKRAAMWRGILATSADPTSSIVFVAEQDDEIVGFGAFGPQRSKSQIAQGFEHEISAIYVRQSAQGRRLGLALMTAMFSSLLERNILAISLWVLRDNAAACRFYERLGGKITEEQADISEHGVLHEVAYGWRDLANFPDTLLSQISR